MPKLFQNYTEHNSKTLASFNFNAPKEMNTPFHAFSDIIQILKAIISSIINDVTTSSGRRIEPIKLVSKK